jgi:hypothetical protein
MPFLGGMCSAAIILAGFEVVQAVTVSAADAAKRQASKAA